MSLQTKREFVCDRSGCTHSVPASRDDRPPNAWSSIKFVGHNEMHFCCPQHLYSQINVVGQLESTGALSCIESIVGCWVSVARGRSPLAGRTRTHLYSAVAPLIGSSGVTDD